MCQCRRHKFDPWVKKIPWGRKWQPTPVFLPKNIFTSQKLDNLFTMQWQRLGGPNNGLKGTQLGCDRTGLQPIRLLTPHPCIISNRRWGRSISLELFQGMTVPMQKTQRKEQRPSDSAQKVQEWKNKPIILYAFKTFFFLIMLFTCHNRAEHEFRSCLKILYTGISKQTT